MFVLEIKTKVMMEKIIFRSEGVLTEEHTDEDGRQEVDVIGPLKQEVNRQTGEERDPDELAQNHDEPDRLVCELFGRQHRALSERYTDGRNTNISFVYINIVLCKFWDTATLNTWMEKSRHASIFFIFFFSIFCHFFFSLNFCHFFFSLNFCHFFSHLKKKKNSIFFSFFSNLKYVHAHLTTKYIPGCTTKHEVMRLDT